MLQAHSEIIPTGFSQLEGELWTFSLLQIGNTCKYGIKFYVLSLEIHFFSC